MNAVPALYYDGASARAIEVMLESSGGQLRIAGEGVSREVGLADLRASSRLGRIRRIVYLPDGAQVHCDDNDAIDALFPRRGLDVLVDRLERHPQAVAGSLLVTVLGAVLFFSYGLPRLADRLARQLPPAAEAAIGEQALAILDRSFFGASELPEDERAWAQEVFGELVAGQPGADRLQLEFRQLGGGEANAFALPGGTVIVSDGLVERLRADEALLAVLAHELGHQQGRHVVRSVLQSSAILVLVAMFTGDVSTASGVVLAVPTFLLEQHYSRAFETEADAYAFDVLRQREVSPEWFAYAITRLGGPTAAAADSDEELHPYLSTHPPSAERLAAAREAAAGHEALEVLLAGSLAEAFGTGQAVPATALAGCWAGQREIAADRYSHWEVRLQDDGQHEIRFSERDGEGVELGSQVNTGRWALRDDVMTIRMLTRARPGEQPRTGDELHGYLIEELTGELLRYESLDGEGDFEATRIACDEPGP